MHGAGEELADEKAANRASLSTTSVKQYNMEKDGADIINFTNLSREKQKEYLDFKQQHKEPILHLLPYLNWEEWRGNMTESDWAFLIKVETLGESILPQFICLDNT